MGSEKDVTERVSGLTRRKDGLLQGAPNVFTLIGVDIEAEALKRKYKGTQHEERACALIDAAEQERRVAMPPTSGFVETCRRGIVTPIHLADLWEDKTGKSHVLIMAGRKRRMSIDILNAEPSAVPLDLIGIVKTFRKADPKGHALSIRSAENCHNPRAHSERAEDAAALMLENVAKSYVVALTECRDEAELDSLLALHECEKDVKDAVDLGKLLLRKAPWYVKQPADAQRDMAARAMAGGSRRAQNEAAAPRAKTRAAPLLKSVEKEMRRTIEGGDTTDHGLMVSAFVEALAYARGGDAPEWAAKYIESAEQGRKAKKGGGK